MASFQKIYDDIERRLKESAIQLNDIQQELIKLREENQRLKQQLLKAREEKQKILTQSLLAQENASQQEKKDNNDIKKEIQEIVREIDNCIGIMKGN